MIFKVISVEIYFQQNEEIKINPEELGPLSYTLKKGVQNQHSFLSKYQSTLSCVVTTHRAASGVLFVHIRTYVVHLSKI